MGLLDERARHRIHQWRKQVGITQAALAQRVGRNPVWISRYLDNAYDADLDTLKQLAEALGRTLTELLGHDPPPSEEGELLERFRSLEPQQRRELMNFLRVLTPQVVWPLGAPDDEAHPAPTKAKRGTPGTRPTRRK
jgi:transcriptional regulator with XRE-family HTH domain